LLSCEDKDASRFVDFFMENVESSPQTASILQQISEEQSLEGTLKVSIVIVS